jgi:hypothetical protein
LLGKSQEIMVDPSPRLGSHKEWIKLKI